MSCYYCDVQPMSKCLSYKDAWAPLAKGRYIIALQYQNPNLAIGGTFTEYLDIKYCPMCGEKLEED